MAPDDPRVAGFAHPGETFFEPMLAVLDWLGGEGYLATIRHSDRECAVARARRNLTLTSERLLLMRDNPPLVISVPLDRIRQVEVVHPRLIGLGKDEAILQLECQLEGWGGDTWVKCGWDAKRADLDAFASKLSELMSKFGR